MIVVSVEVLAVWFSLTLLLGYTFGVLMDAFEQVAFWNKQLRNNWLKGVGLGAAVTTVIWASVMLWWFAR